MTTPETPLVCSLCRLRHMVEISLVETSGAFNCNLPWQLSEWDQVDRFGFGLAVATLRKCRWYRTVHTHTHTHTER